MSDTYKASEIFGRTVSGFVENVEKQVKSRAYRASNELRNASLYVLRGTRSGRTYKVPATHGYRNAKGGVKGKSGVYYTASAPGEAPAVRTGIFRASWETNVTSKKSNGTYEVAAQIKSDLMTKGGDLIGELLENQKGRHYKQAVIDRAMPKIQAIFDEPYV